MSGTVDLLGTDAHEEGDGGTDIDHLTGSWIRA